MSVLEEFTYQALAKMACRIALDVDMADAYDGLTIDDPYIAERVLTLEAINKHFATNTAFFGWADALDCYEQTAEFWE